MSDPLDAPNPGGRPPVLDEEKRRTVIAMLANGSSRRMAANYVGCSPLTLTRTILRDPDFAAAVARAEQNTEIDALRRVRQASHNERYWRAAAWLLERRNPQDFAQRPPRAYTDQQISQLFILATNPFVEKMSDDDFDEAMERLDELVRQSRLDPEEGPGGKRPRALPEPDPFAVPPSGGATSFVVPPSRGEAASDDPSDPLSDWDDGESDFPSGGSFDTDNSNGECDWRKNPSSQHDAVQAFQIIPILPPGVST